MTASEVPSTVTRRDQAASEPMPIERAYHYVHNQKGDWLWTYFDPVKRRWFLHGRVE